MDKAGDHLERMRGRAPLVHSITNFVAMDLAANVLLALGASPAMVHAREEAAEFAALAAALAVNIGTPDPAWGEAMVSSAEVMARAGRPWVLDPVAVGATGFRRDLAGRLIALGPTVVRGNASEILALAGLGGAARGVDAGDSVEAAAAAALALARETGGVVAATGKVDFVTDGDRAYRVANGHPLMPLITALGCALDGAIAAFCVGEAPLEASVAALAAFGVAGEVAGAAARGPGSFRTAFLDALHGLDGEALNAAARIEPA